VRGERTLSPASVAAASFSLREVTVPWPRSPLDTCTPSRQRPALSPDPRWRGRKGARCHDDDEQLSLLLPRVWSRTWRKSAVLPAPLGPTSSSESPRLDRNSVRSNTAAHSPPRQRTHRGQKRGRSCLCVAQLPSASTAHIRRYHQQHASCVSSAVPCGRSGFQNSARPTASCAHCHVRSSRNSHVPHEKQQGGPPAGACVAGFVPISSSRSTTAAATSTIGLGLVSTSSSITCRRRRGIACARQPCEWISALALTLRSDGSLHARDRVARRVRRHSKGVLPTPHTAGTLPPRESYDAVRGTARALSNEGPRRVHTRTDRTSWSHPHVWAPRLTFTAVCAGSLGMSGTQGGRREEAARA
jgi:hypothetical protein